VAKRAAKKGTQARLCKGCGIGFYPKDRRQKYHTPGCREKYYDKTYWPKTIVEKTCPVCKTVFPTSKPKKQTYCSPDCRKATKHKKSADKVVYTITALAVCKYCGRKNGDDGVTLILAPMDKDHLMIICSRCLEEGKDASVSG
jgi:hypothetical protein